MKNVIVMLACLVGLAFHQPVSASEPEVKLSTSGICHDKTSKFYSRTKNFTPYDSLDACIADGFRAPYKRSDNKSDNNQYERSSTFQPAGTVAKYNRKAYKHWIDADNDCQNLRQELLIETSQVPVTFTNQRKCTVKTGKWYDLYTNKTYTKSSDLDLDHVVPLGWAHYRGAASWSPSKKQAFANDVDNLLLVRDIQNQTKSAQGPSTWLPPHQAYRCDYIAHFMRVVAKYDLRPKAGETRVINRMLKACN